MLSSIICREKTQRTKSSKNANHVGVEAIAVQGDVSVWQDAQNLANKAIEKFGKIDLLVLNAGIWEGSPIEEMSEETLEQSFKHESESGVGDDESVRSFNEKTG